MAANGWSRIRVVVELAVRHGTVPEREFRWAVQQALGTSRTFDEVLRRRPGAERVYARRLVVKQYTKIAAAKHRTAVPRSGGEAFAQGWSDGSCPWPGGSVEAVRWYADWWTANAAAFEDHVRG